MDLILLLLSANREQARCFLRSSLTLVSDLIPGLPTAAKRVEVHCTKTTDCHYTAVHFTKRRLLRKEPSVSGGVGSSIPSQCQHLCYEHRIQNSVVLLDQTVLHSSRPKHCHKLFEQLIVQLVFFFFICGLAYIVWALYIPFLVFFIETHTLPCKIKAETGTKPQSVHVSAQK